MTDMTDPIWYIWVPSLAGIARGTNGCALCFWSFALLPPAFQVAKLAYGLRLATCSRRTTTTKFFAPLCGGGFLLCGPALAMPPPDLTATPLARTSPEIVVEGRARVVDGDTLVLEEGDGEKERIRILGIDAPETKQSCQGPDGQGYACGVESGAYLRQLIQDDPVQCLAAKRDMYSRILGVCFDERTGTELGEEMVRAGEAVAYTQYSKAYVPVEAQARESKRGLWGGEFENPWDYRKAKRAGADRGTGTPEVPSNPPATSAGQLRVLTAPPLRVAPEAPSVGAAGVPKSSRRASGPPSTVEAPKATLDQSVVLSAPPLRDVAQPPPSARSEGRRRDGVGATAAGPDLSGTPLARAEQSGKVEIVVEGRARVVDGDTLVLEEGDGEKERIRILGIDAPETKQSCQGPDGQGYACGVESGAYLRQLIQDDPVQCLAAKRDMYSRILGVCFDERTGTELGEEMVRAGEAVAYTQYSKAYVPVEAQARESKRGLWGGEFENPWDYRKAKRSAAKATAGSGP